MIKFLLILFFGWLLYKLVFGFILPVYHSTKHVRQQMNDMQQRMRQQYEEQQASAQQSQHTSSNIPPRPTADKGDYLDFEEIK